MAKSTRTKDKRQGSVKFRPRARIIQTLGRDLISNETIAIQELIKNAYDADAKGVTITFEEPLLPGKGAIVISDNGDGMSLDTIKKAWMEPATISKVRKTTTRRGRRVTGEKGIGRFAAARVASVLEMTTIPRNLRQQIRVRFDWGAFEDQSRYLDQIRCYWHVDPAPPRTHSGTSLRLVGLNDTWDQNEKLGITSFTDLRGQLSRLVAPLKGDEFTITLELPERLKDYGGTIEPPEILGKPHYKLTGSMDSSGALTATYEGPDTAGRLLESDGSKPIVFGTSKSPPSCGPFKFEFRVWDRSKEALEPLAKQLNETLRDIQRDLNAASGISVYRDNFRVLIPENDWLRLDFRRVQNPTMRLSNNQVVGRVFISADKNRGLKDQTNRQGIVDSPQLGDFKAALREILSKLEVRRDHFRRSQSSPAFGPGIFQKLEFAPVAAYLINRYPNDPELKNYLEQTGKTFNEGIGEVQQVLSRYRRLATLGQLIDVVLHEGRTPVSTIRNQVDLIRKEISKTGDNLPLRIEERISRIGDQTEVLNLLFKRLAPFSGRKRGRPAQTTIEQLIKDAFDLHAKDLKDLNVEAEMPVSSTPVTVDPAEMQTIFLNLLENSLYWLERVPKQKRKIVVQVKSALDGLQIIFSDSGPGVAPDDSGRIFDPYFSTKPEGVGLGLTIAGEMAAEYDGGLELLSSGPLAGATFRIVLRKRLGFENG